MTELGTSYRNMKQPKAVPNDDVCIWEMFSSITSSTTEFDGIYIATGGVLNEELEHIGINQVSVPGYFYKAIFSPKIAAVSNPAPVKSMVLLSKDKAKADNPVARIKLSSSSQRLQFINMSELPRVTEDAKIRKWGTAIAKVQEIPCCHNPMGDLKIAPDSA